MTFNTRVPLGLGAGGFGGVAMGGAEMGLVRSGAGLEQVTSEARGRRFARRTWGRRQGGVERGGLVKFRCVSCSRVLPYPAFYRMPEFRGAEARARVGGRTRAFSCLECWAMGRAYHVCALCGGVYHQVDFVRRTVARKAVERGLSGMTPPVRECLACRRGVGRKWYGEVKGVKKELLGEKVWCKVCGKRKARRLFPRGEGGECRRCVGKRERARAFVSAMGSGEKEFVAGLSGEPIAMMRAPRETRDLGELRAAMATIGKRKPRLRWVMGAGGV